MKASYYLAIPNKFQNREKIRLNEFAILNIFDNIIKFNVKNKYIAELWFENGILSPASQVKFNCTCDSFKYQFSQIVALNNSHLKLDKPTIRLPKKYPTHYICKHLESCLKYIIRFKNISTLSKLIKK